ncbi:hypothetical protein BU23DRAFT_601793 [Bimuria novae-zelandiae CBS 107.79]|uniref:Zn(2)-C6 fungal-type domain-containing protein n=1 Tax=Bimuria novae-zelandiae CBS 107.79 TaxID=1447943 RepID=A0A6A5UWQ1_9PLEO|nr:hypothetical protein BU23DRAFT_601793 [Bimuria novae-zelandiae CBS 107.79]
MSQQTAHRLLLPKPLGGLPLLPSELPEARTAKRKRTPGACAPCRTRKSKCDAAQPECGECSKRQSRCIYELTPAKRKYDDLETRAQKAENSQSLLQELIHALRSRPEADSQAILRHLREGHDVESILRHVTAGDLLLQLHVEPETRFRFVFPFRHQMPSFLQSAENQFLGSVLYQRAFTVPEGQDSSFPPINELYGPQYSKPYSSATIVDPKLEAVKPSDWTQYPSWPAFQKDLFLDDMLSGSKRNCSSLHVNVVLAYACHCHLALLDRLEYWNPHSLGYRFLAEAKRLWEEGSRKSHITKVQAGILMFSLYGAYSMSNLGMTYAAQAAIMANDLDIFGPPRQTWTERKKHAYGFTAWCVYYYCSYRASRALRALLGARRPGSPGVESIQLLANSDLYIINITNALYLFARRRDDRSMR